MLSFPAANPCFSDPRVQGTGTTYTGMVNLTLIRKVLKCYKLNLSLPFRAIEMGITNPQSN